MTSYSHSHTNQHSQKSTMKIAIFGDQGLGSNPKKVLRMVQDWGAELILHLGDFDYVDSPIEFIAQLETTFIHDSFNRYAHVPWKICMWHKNQAKLQTGDKNDETGYAVYEACREHGAIVFTAHEHSYERTHLLYSFETQEIVHTSNILDVKPGQSFVAVSGLGGDSIRSWKNNNELNPWWAAKAALDNGVNYGSLLCEFQLKGDPMVSDYGTIWDNFTVNVPENPIEQLRVQRDRMPKKRTGFMEFSIKSPSDIKTHIEGILTSNKTLLVFPTQSDGSVIHELTFKVSLPKGVLIREAYLQMMTVDYLRQGGNVNLIFDSNIKNQFPNNPHQKIVGMGDYSRVTSHFELEHGDVYNSPNLVSLLPDYTNQRHFDVIIQFQGYIDNSHAKETGFLGIHDVLGTCISPTLAFVTENKI
ncbi:hypothetical protein HDV02_004978 [Globomyces sp. JEL0801]|nr:hypothetical protein HDV02_004978 [Globomyces sp. JEL0801]